MTDEANNQKPDIVEMAKKKRHIKIIKKLRDPDDVPTKSEVKELSEYEGGGLKPGVVNSQDQVAKAFGVAVRTVANWVKEDMPMTSDGKYNVADIQAWKLVREEKKKGREKEKDDPKQRVELYKALTAEIEYKKLIGELIDRDRVERELIMISNAAKQALLGLPRAMARELEMQPARLIEAKIKKRMHEVIKKFSTGSIFEKIKMPKPRKKPSNAPNDLFDEGS